MTLRVIHLVPGLSGGGAEGVAAQIAVGLDADKYESMVVALQSDGGAGSNADWSCYNGNNGLPVADATDRLRDAGVQVQAVDKTSPGPTFARLKRVVRAFRPHVVHSHANTVQYALPMLLSRRAPARLHTLHATAEAEAESSRDRWIRRVFFRTGGRPIAVSEAVQRSARELYSVSSDLVMSRVDLEPFAASGVERGQRWRSTHGYGERDMIFVMVGSIDEVDDPVGLLRAFRPVWSQNAHTRLLMVGGGDGVADVQEYVGQHDLQGAVQVLPATSDVRDVLAASDVFVLSSRREALNQRIMQAMAAGLPVIATGVGANSEIVDTGSTGLLVPDGEPDKMSIAMRTMIDGETFRADCARRATRDASRRFDASDMVREYAELYERYRPRFD